jgi:sortase A
MRNRSSSWLFRILEWTLFGIGGACLGWYSWRTVEIHRLRSDAHAALERMLAEPERGGRVEGTPSPADGGTIGQLDIPRIHLSAVVMKGDDDAVLDYAIGYLADTPLPWQPGNSVLAAHRDGLFRPLRDIRIGDDIWLTTQHGGFRYRVRRTLIVNPSDVWVLDPIPRVSLTLITCYPFSYVGHAPRRFIVQAEKL